jgi:hypothetical protein
MYGESKRRESGMGESQVERKARSVRRAKRKVVMLPRRLRSTTRKTGGDEGREEKGQESACRRGRGQISEEETTNRSANPPPGSPVLHQASSNLGSRSPESICDNKGQ